jgi:chromosome partitioning protein
MILGLAERKCADECHDFQEKNRLAEHNDASGERLRTQFSPVRDRIPPAPIYDVRSLDEVARPRYFPGGTIWAMSDDPAKSCRVLTVLNLKGGVGKTHTAWLLASVCQERNERVLLIDTDTQGNLSGSFLDPEDTVPGVESLLHPGSDRDPLPLIRKTAFRNIDIIPSSAAVAKFDRSDKADWEKSDLHRCFIDPIQAVSGGYSMVVFDCPPRLSLVSFAALAASDAIIIPMETADWGAQGIEQVTSAVTYVKKRYNPKLALLGYLASRHKQARVYHKVYLESLRKHYGELAFDTVIPDLAAFERAVTDRIPVTLHSPRSRAASVARKFFDEVKARLERVRGVGDRLRRSRVFKKTTVGAAA